MSAFADQFFATIGLMYALILINLYAFNGAGILPDGHHAGSASTQSQNKYPIIRSGPLASGCTVICCGNHGGNKMYSRAAKVDAAVNRSAGSQPVLCAPAPCEKRRGTNRPKCFGSSEVYFCEYMECPYRKACEKLVSAWSLEL